MMEMDRTWMLRALELAARARGRTSPNPMVGAVLVRENQLVGEGFHAYAGSDHAEIAALREAGSNAAGATLYVSLEPCCHFGRTPPCVDQILQAGLDVRHVTGRPPVGLGREIDNPLGS